MARPVGFGSEGGDGDGEGGEEERGVFGDGVCSREVDGVRVTVLSCSCSLSSEESLEVDELSGMVIGFDMRRGRVYKSSGMILCM